MGIVDEMYGGMLVGDGRMETRIEEKILIIFASAISGFMCHPNPLGQWLLSKGRCLLPDKISSAGLGFTPKTFH